MSIIRDKLVEEIDLSQEGMDSFLVHWEGNMRDGFNPFCVYFNPTLCDNMAQEISLRHCENTLFGIKGYPVFATSLNFFL